MSTGNLIPKFSWKYKEIRIKVLEKKIKVKGLYFVLLRSTAL